MALCQICGFEKAVYKCKRCGRWVCEFDWAGEHCAVCEYTQCRVCKRRFSISTCVICGAVVCGGCSVKRGLGRICKNCLVLHK
ncbi:MAG: hypothetical protein QXK71_00415 [Pyrobaculum sp.]